MLIFKKLLPLLVFMIFNGSLALADDLYNSPEVKKIVTDYANRWTNYSLHMPFWQAGFDDQTQRTLNELGEGEKNKLGSALEISWNSSEKKSI